MINMIEDVEVRLTKQKLFVFSYVRQSGDKWLLCLHGIQSNKTLFSGLLQSPAFNQYSLLCPDFIGFGKSGKPENFSYDLHQQRDVIIALLDHLNIDRVSIVGHSFGGMVATMMLDEIPNRLSALCNVEGNLRIDTCSTTKKAGDVSLEEFERHVYPNIIASIRNSREPSSVSRLEALSVVSARVFYKTSQSILACAESGRLFDLFTNAAIPRVLMFGQNGPFASWSSKNTLPTVEIKDASHFVPQDNPVQFEHTLSKFLSCLQ